MYIYIYICIHIYKHIYIERKNTSEGLFQLAEDVAWPETYRGTSLTRKRTPLGPYRRPVPRVLGGS